MAPVKLNARKKMNMSSLPAAIRKVFRQKTEVRQRDERPYRVLAESSFAGVYLIQEDVFRYVNPVFAATFGYEVDELTDKLGLLDLTAREDHSRAQRISWRGVDDSVREVRYALRGVRKDGTVIIAEVYESHILFEGKPAIVGTLLDITERTQVEDKVKERAGLLEIHPSAIFQLDLDGRFSYWNKGAERLYGWTRDEVMRRRWIEIMPEADVPEHQIALEAVRRDGGWKGEYVQSAKDGKTVTVESEWTLVRDGHGNPKSVYVVNNDITEKKKIEAQYLRAQRLESIGSLSSGIAHDFNNLLSPVLLSVELLKRKALDEGERKLLDNIETSANRGAALVKQILSFARGMEGDRIGLSPKHIISELSDMLKSTFPPSIRIESNVAKDLWTVEGDPTQLHQVLMNLCVNARDAMLAGGKLVISAENVVVDEQYANMSINGKPGSYVRITISDTGVGMSPEVLTKVFEPFFTTKESEKGTGLGLSTVYSIVKGHRGFVNVYSEPGKGTSFRVYLPSTLVVKEVERPRIANGIPFGHGEGILVIDDEAAIREITKATLENWGYRANIAIDGVEALSEFTRRTDDIQLVIVDMMMPNMDGISTIKALQRLQSRTRFIAVSGSAEEERTAELESRNVRFLQKPYTAETLIRAVSEMLAIQPI